MLLFRRLRQIRQAIFTRYNDNEVIFRNTIRRYSTIAELDFYKKYNSFGLEAEEKTAAKIAIDVLGDHPKALVIGCGAGREAFALEKLGFMVTAIDASRSMIEVAINESSQHQSKVHFISCDLFSLKTEMKFDFLFVTPGLMGHLPGKELRVSFYERLLNLSSLRSVIFMYPEIKILGRSDTLYWASQLLRLKWFAQNKWQPGDTLKSFLGNHNKDETLFFYHFYPSRQDFLSELAEAKIEPLEHLSPYLFTSREQLLKFKG